MQVWVFTLGPSPSLGLNWIHQNHFVCSEVITIIKNKSIIMKLQVFTLEPSLQFSIPTILQTHKKNQSFNKQINT